MSFSQKDISTMRKCASSIRVVLERKYGTDSYSLMGKCIEASDSLTELLKHFNYKAEVKQVWCLYENFEGCNDCCYEEHWVVKVTSGGDIRFIDVTMDQFQWAFSRKLPSIYVEKRLPNFMLSRKPGKTTLDRCGWNSWYKYGDYENNFNY